MASSKTHKEFAEVSVTRPTLASAATVGPNTREHLADVKKYLILILKQFLGNKSDDQGVRQFMLFAADLVKLIKYELNSLTNYENNELFQEIYEVLSIDTAKYLEQNHTRKDVEDMKHMQLIQARIMDMLKDIFDEDSPIMADVYYRIADIKYKKMLFQEGIEYSGLCLKIRIKQLGLLHLKTSDSHYQLGYLYMNLGNYTNAEKESLISRKIRIKCIEAATNIGPPSSPPLRPIEISDDEKNAIYLAIADCDYQLTQIEKHLYQSKKVYAYIYSCYHYRKLVLGASNPLTKLVSDMTLLHNYVQGERMICSTELKERATELGLNVQDTDPNVQYLKAVINCFTALDDDVCLSMGELNELITSAVLNKAKRNRVNTDDTSYVTNNQDMIDGIFRLVLITSGGSAPSSPSVNGRKVNSLAATMPVTSPSSPTLTNTALSATMSSYTSPSVSKIRSPHSSGKTKSIPEPVESGNMERVKDTSIYDFFSSPARKNLSRPIQPNNKQRVVVNPSKHSIPRRHRVRSNSPERKVGDKHIKGTDETAAVEDASNNNHGRGSNEQSVDSIVVMFGDRNTQFVGYDLLSKRLFTPGEVKFQDVVQYQRKEVAALNIFAYIIEKIRSKETLVDDNSGRYGPKMPLASPLMPPPLPTSWPPKPYQGGSTLASDDLSLQRLPLTDREDKPAGLGGSVLGPKYKRINGVDPIPLIANTIWSDNLESIVAPALLFPDIEEEFRSDKVASKLTKNDKFRTSKQLESAKESLDLKKRQLNSVNTRVLNPQRCQHISIMLAKFGRTESKDIRKGVEDFDIEAIGLTAISSIEKFLPTSEEVAALNNVIEKNKLLIATAISAEALGDGGNSVPELKQYKLDKAEEYLYEISQVKNVKQKLRAMTVSICVREIGIIVENNSDAIMRAVHEVRGSSKFKFILKSVVDLLNMIGKSADSGAGVTGGVRLSSLNKLSLNKTNSGETLDRYLVYRLIQVVPEIVDMEADFPSLEDAKKVVFETMKEELKKLEQGISVMEHFNLEEESTVAAMRISDHIKECRNVYKVAHKQLLAAVTEYQALCQYFGEDSAQLDPFTLFSTLQTFIRTIQTNGNLAKAKIKRLAMLQQHP